MKTPAISIVMPVYNAEDYLNESIDSILNQTFTNFELIIVDDESTDNSINIIKAYGDSRIILIENPHDFIKSLNTGIAASKGKYIARMDADDVMLPYRLETQFNFMENNLSIDVCGSWAKAFGLNPHALFDVPLKHEEICSQLLLKCCLFNPTIIFRKESLSKLSFFPHIYNKEYIYAEDYKLWTDLSLEGFKFANIPQILLNYRISERQVTTRLSSHMGMSRDRIQWEYLECILEKVVENDKNLFGFIDNSIEIFNTDKLTLSTLKYIVSDIYDAQLKDIRQKNKIKILFCIDTLGGGGAEKVLIDILKYFDYDKYCVDLLILSNEGIYFADIPYQVYWFTLNDKEVTNNLYDVEIAFLEGLSLKYIAQRKSNAKKIAWVHADLFNFHWTKRFYYDDQEEESCYSQMDKIVFVSQDVKKQFNRYFHNITTSQDIIYNLIDVHNIQKKTVLSSNEKKKLTLCSVGRLTGQKGYARLIPIIDRLINKDGLDFELWIVGEGEQRQEIEKLIRKYSLENIIYLMGFQKNPYPYIKTSDIFLSISHSEGYPLVVCEAICLHKPVVATKVAGTIEILDNGKYGLLTEQDEESIYQGLKRMITDKSLREEYSQKARSRSEIFDVTKSMNTIYKVLTIDNKSQ